MWDADVDNLTESKNNSKYLISYLGEVIRQIVLILNKRSEYVKAFKYNNKLMPLHIDDDKLFEKY